MSFQKCGILQFSAHSQSKKTKQLKPHSLHTAVTNYEQQMSSVLGTLHIFTIYTTFTTVFICALTFSLFFSLEEHFVTSVFKWCYMNKVNMSSM